VLRVKILPAFVVETFRVAAKVLIREFARFFNVVDRENIACEIRFDDVLEPSYLRMIEEAAAGADVGVDVAGVRRILPPVGEFVAVGGQDRIEAEWLDVMTPKLWPSRLVVMRTRKAGSSRRSE
jgi:hypothetical protein